MSITAQSANRSTVRQLRADVEAICLPRGRVVGSPGHRGARRVLIKRLEDLGCVPWRGDSFELPYRRKGVEFCNIAGVVRGHNPRLAPLLVGSHYDSAIPAPPTTMRRRSPSRWPPRSSPPTRRRLSTTW